jgi:hypothetical protein
MQKIGTLLKMLAIRQACKLKEPDSLSKYRIKAIYAN